MPNVTATPRGQGNGQVLTEIIDSVGTASVTYTYPKTQEWLAVRNTGTQSIVVTAGAVSQAIQPGKRWEANVSFVSFDIVSASGIQSFEVVADEKGSFYDSLATQFAVQAEFDKRGINVQKYGGAEGDGIADDTGKIADALLMGSSSKVFVFPAGTYLVSSIVFPNNSIVLFLNAKFKRSGGTGAFITTGQNTVFMGSLEIDGNKSSFDAASKIKGLYVSQGSRIFANVYAHDCCGHGITLESDTQIYSPKSINNGANPGASGTGDGIYCVNANQVYIENAYCTGNARMGITDTTYNGSGIDKALSTDVHVRGAYVNNNGYNGIDIEGVGGGLFEDITGWDSITASTSERCTLLNIECKGLYASSHDYIKVRNIKCKPVGAATNVFFVSGKNPDIDGVYLFDTATSYASNTFEVADSVNQKATLKNITVENGFNAIVGTGIVALENCESLAAANQRIRIDLRRPNALYQRGFRVVGGVAIFQDSAAPIIGTWKQGDRFDLIAPVAAGKIGQVCVAAGTPGTWKPWGVIDA